MSKIDRHLLFIAYCWGGAGSTWLAWALNSHRDVLSLHAPNFPRYNRRNRHDALAIIRAFYELPALGSSYRCVGFTHGVRREWHTALLKQYGECLRAFILTRHSIKRINSLTAIKNKTSQARPFSVRDHLSRNRSYAKLLAASRRRDFPRDTASMSFYHSCYGMNRILSEVATGLPIYRFEDLVGTVDKFQELLGFISDTAVQMTPDHILDLQATIKGKHASKRLTVSDAYAEWSDIQKEAFRYLVTPQTVLAYERLGYEFPDAVLPEM